MLGALRGFRGFVIILRGVRLKKTANQTFGFQNASGIHLRGCLKLLGVVEDAAESLVRASRLENLGTFVDGVVPFTLL